MNTTLRNYITKQQVNKKALRKQDFLTNGNKEKNYPLLVANVATDVSVTN